VTTNSAHRRPSAPPVNRGWVRRARAVGVTSTDRAVPTGRTGSQAGATVPAWAAPASPTAPTAPAQPDHHHRSYSCHGCHGSGPGLDPRVARPVVGRADFDAAGATGATGAAKPTCHAGRRRSVGRGMRLDPIGRADPGRPEGAEAPTEVRSMDPEGHASPTSGLGTALGGDRPSEATGAVLPGARASMGDLSLELALVEPTGAELGGVDDPASPDQLRSPTGRLPASVPSAPAAPTLTSTNTGTATTSVLEVTLGAAPARAGAVRGPATGDESVTWVVDTVADELFMTWGRLGVIRRWGPIGGRPGMFVPTPSGTAAGASSSGDRGLSTYPPPLVLLLASDSSKELIPIGWGQAQIHPLLPAFRTLASSPAVADGGHDAFQD
jgi:hypothetical protein